MRTFSHSGFGSRERVREADGTRAAGPLEGPPSWTRFAMAAVTYPIAGPHARPRLVRRASLWLFVAHGRSRPGARIAARHLGDQPARARTRARAEAGRLRRRDGGGLRTDVPSLPNRVWVCSRVAVRGNCPGRSHRGRPLAAIGARGRG